MTRYTYESDVLTTPALGLVVLQEDETLEGELRTMVAPHVPVHVTRVPSDPEVTPETLSEMEAHLTAAARLLPRAVGYAAVGYGCTSGAAQIGADTVAHHVRSGAQTKHVTEPLSALTAVCRALDLKRIAFLSPYVPSVSEHLRAILAYSGINTPVFGGFDEAEEAKVVRISPQSIIAAASDLAHSADVDALFLSCTNLRTLSVIGPLEAALNMPVLSSNQVLAWHMGQLAGVPVSGPGRLLQSQS